MELVFAELQYQYNPLNIVSKTLIVVYLVIFLSKTLFSHEFIGVVSKALNFMALKDFVKTEINRISTK